MQQRWKNGDCLCAQSWFLQARSQLYTNMKPFKCQKRNPDMTLQKLPIIIFMDIVHFNLFRGFVCDNNNCEVKVNFGSNTIHGKFSHSPTLTHSFRISLRHTCSSLATILPSNWFRLAHLPMSNPARIFSFMVLPTVNIGFMWLMAEPSI